MICLQLLLILIQLKYIADHMREANFYKRKIYGGMMNKIKINLNCNLNEFLHNWEKDVEEYTLKKLNKGKYETFLGNINDDEIFLSFCSNDKKVNISMTCFKGKIIEKEDKLYIEGKFTVPFFKKIVALFMVFITLVMIIGLELSIFTLFPFWLLSDICVRFFHHYDYVKEMLINKIKILGNSKADYVCCDKYKLSKTKRKILHLIGVILILISIFTYLKMIGNYNQQRLCTILGFVGIILSVYFNKEKRREMLIGKEEFSLIEELYLNGYEYGDKDLDEIEDTLYEEDYKFNIGDLLRILFIGIISFSIIAIIINLGMGSYKIPKEFTINKTQRPNYFVTQFLVDDDKFYIEKAFNGSVEVYDKNGDFLNTVWIGKNEEFINAYLNDKENIFMLSTDSEYENYYLYVIDKDKFTLKDKIQRKEEDVEEFEYSNPYEGMTFLESIAEDIYPTAKKDNTRYKLKFNKIIVNEREDQVINLENSKLLPLPMGLLIIFVFVSLSGMYIIEYIEYKMTIKKYIYKRKRV